MIPSLLSSRLSNTIRVGGYTSCLSRLGTWETHRHFADKSSSSSDSSREVDKLSKTELVRLVAAKTGFNQGEAKKCLEAIVQVFKEELVAGKSIPLTTFGTFSSYVSKARKCRNPHTGEGMEIGPKRRLRFKPYKDFKDALAKNI